MSEPLDYLICPHCARRYERDEIDSMPGNEVPKCVDDWCFEQVGYRTELEPHYPSDKL